VGEAARAARRRLDDAFARFQVVDENGEFAFRVSPTFFRIDEPFTSPTQPGRSARRTATRCRSSSSRFPTAR